MLHKPQGYVCSHDDGDYPTIYQFFEPPLSGKLHSAGRLDVDTTGLVLLTDDGQWSLVLPHQSINVRKPI